MSDTDLVWAELEAFGQLMWRFGEMSGDCRRPRPKLAIRAERKGGCHSAAGPRNASSPWPPLAARYAGVRVVSHSTTKKSRPFAVTILGASECGGRVVRNRLTVQQAAAQLSTLRIWVTRRC